jgi:hypothetical protein
VIRLFKLNWQFVTGVLVGICFTLAWTISKDVSSLTKRIQADTEITKRLIHQRTEILTCEINLGQANEALRLCKTVPDKTDYVLWEVHALAKDPGRLEPEAGQKLCDEVGSHSTLRAGTHLAAYNFWDEPSGQPMLGCRYIKPKEEP